MILGVGRIDSDKRHVAPVLAAFERRRLRGIGLAQGGIGKHVRNIVRVNGDERDGALGFQRTEPFLDAASGEAEAASLQQIGGDEFAILRAAGVTRGNGDFTALLFFVDGHKPAAAVGHGAEDAENTRARIVQNLDDAAGMADRFTRFAAFLGTQQHAVADGAGSRCAAHGDDADFRRRAVCVLVPFGWNGDQFALESRGP